MSMAKIVKIPTDKSPVLQLYSQDIARASALRATIPRIDYGLYTPLSNPIPKRYHTPCEMAVFFYYRTTKPYNPKKPIT